MVSLKEEQKLPELEDLGFVLALFTDLETEVEVPISSFYHTN